MNENGHDKTNLQRECVMRKVDKGRPRKSHADQTDGALKKCRILSTRNRRNCMKLLMDVGGAREMYKDRTMWESISACLSSNILDISPPWCEYPDENAPLFLA
ncbi:hypothetical protein EVAR_91536_1 [Eumeta japonica]|uniref:Uncharacterized protein n=1 Tax=Eumeta variegata TaxID=151549 RepID=A0A4C1VDF8_EUMVA|nr:hypothetical protein EVAR_91536_1 [Eumeta japonica]